MKIYTVERLDKFDYDFSVEHIKCGCFHNRNSALERSKQVYEKMCGEYEDEMRRYADEECEASGKTRVIEDDEYGYYLIAFGHDEDYECHSVSVEAYEIEDELDHWDKRKIYDELHEYYLIEDIKGRLEDAEIYAVEGDVLRNLAHKAQKSLDNNDSYWDSYWCVIENVIEEYCKEV